MGDLLTGKKTYILVLLGLISAFALYIQQVVTSGFDISGFLKFLQSEAIVAAIGTLRLAVGKK